MRRCRTAGSGDAADEPSGFGDGDFSPDEVAADSAQPS
jgi:hypothetical protein